MKKQIITIDFDVIMAPSIIFYNPLVPHTEWDDILSYPMGQALQADYGLYYKLTEFLMYITKNLSANQIHFITNHEQVVNFLDSNETYNIINIDHHHDMGYGNSRNPDADLNCSNWVKILMDKEQCVSYTWIRNENSETDPEIENIYHNKILREVDLYQLPVPEQLFIVVSPEWVPPQFTYLLDCWFVILNRLYDVNFTLH